MTNINKKEPVIRFDGFTDAWKQRKLGDNSIIKGRLGWKSLKQEEYTESGPAMIAGRHIVNGHIDWSKVDHIPQWRYDESPEIMLENDDVIFSKDGSLGNPALIEKLDNLATINSTMMLVRTDKTIDSKFFYQVLTSDQFKKLIYLKVSGSSIPHLFQADMNEFTFFTPSVNEQTKIGNFFKQLDETIILQERELVLLKEQKKSLLQKMFPKKGSKVPEIRFAEFTDAWEQCKFGALIKEKREKTKIENEDTLLSCAIDGMYLNSELFGHFRGSSNIGYLKIKMNDMILSAQNLHLGNANINMRFDHGIISPAYKVYSLTKAEPNFMNAWLKADSTKNFFERATTEGASVCRKNILWNDLYKQTLFVPILIEQERIGSFFKQLDETIMLKERKLATLKNMKKSFLQKMFV